MTDTLNGVSAVGLAASSFVPAAGAELADWGAHVVKVENTEAGDPLREVISSGDIIGAGGVNHFAEQPNRGKRSIGRELIRARNLRIIYARSHGYGAKGDRAMQGVSP